MSSPPEASHAAGTRWACPDLLQSSFFLRACALQATGSAELSLEGEEVPLTPPDAMAAALLLHLPEPRPTTAELINAGDALHLLLQQQPLPVCDPRQVFAAAPFAPVLSSLPLPTLLALLQVSDLASLPPQLTAIVTATLAQASAAQPWGALEAQLSPLSPRCAALLRQWWAETYTGADFGPVLQGSLPAWRAAHPTALVANVSGRRDLQDADFACLQGIRALDMSSCSQHCH
jgi:hypothetical protein